MSFRFPKLSRVAALAALTALSSQALAQSDDEDPSIRIERLENQLRQLTGQNEELQYRNHQLEEQLRQLQGGAPPGVAAAMHDCFESVDVSPLLPSITGPVLLLSGDNSPIASAQQKALAETLPNGRVELFAGYGHGVNLLQPERCSRAALEFWGSIV